MSDATQGGRSVPGREVPGWSQVPELAAVTQAPAPPSDLLLSLRAALAIVLTAGPLLLYSLIPVAAFAIWVWLVGWPFLSSFLQSAPPPAPRGMGSASTGSMNPRAVVALATAPIFLIVWAATIVRSAWKARAGPPEPSIQVDRDLDRGLWEFVERVAEESQLAPPDAIGLTAGVGASVSVSPWSGRARLELGMAALSMLDPQDLATVVTHELSHAKRRPGWRTRILLRRLLVFTHALAEQGKPVVDAAGRKHLRRPLIGITALVNRLALRMGRPIWHAEEHHADLDAARLSGRRGALRALWRLSLLSGGQHMTGAVIQRHWQTDGLPANLPQAIRSTSALLPADAVDAHRRALTAERPVLASLTHPTMASRAAVLPDDPPRRTPWPQVRLRDAAAREAELTSRLEPWASAAAAPRLDDEAWVRLVHADRAAWRSMERHGAQAMAMVLSELGRLPATLPVVDRPMDRLRALSRQATDAFAAVQPIILSWRTEETAWLTLRAAAALVEGGLPPMKLTPRLPWRGAKKAIQLRVEEATRQQEARIASLSALADLVVERCVLAWRLLRADPDLAARCTGAMELLGTFITRSRGSQLRDSDPLLPAIERAWEEARVCMMACAHLKQRGLMGRRKAKRLLTSMAASLHAALARATMTSEGGRPTVTPPALEDYATSAAAAAGEGMNRRLLRWAELLAIADAFEDEHARKGGQGPSRLEADSWENVLRTS